MHRYTVLVDDNYHFMDSSERYSYGDFETLETAIAACKRIVDEFLEERRKDRESSTDKLYEYYQTFGPDPFIQTDDPLIPSRPFSAWDYARDQCYANVSDFGRLSKDTKQKVQLSAPQKKTGSANAEPNR